MWHVPLKRTLTFNGQHGIISQKSVLCHSTVYQSIFVLYSIWNSNVSPPTDLDHFLLIVVPPDLSTVTVSRTNTANRTSMVFR